MVLCVFYYPLFRDTMIKLIYKFLGKVTNKRTKNQIYVSFSVALSALIFEHPILRIDENDDFRIMLATAPAMIAHIAANHSR